MDVPGRAWLSLDGAPAGVENFNICRGIAISRV